MRLHLPTRLPVAITAFAAILVVVLLLSGAVPATRLGTAEPGPATFSSSTVGRGASTSGASTPGAPVSNPPPVGHVVTSPLLNYNTSIPGNFGTSVWDWSIGPGTVVPATGDLWLANNLTRTYPGPLPLSAPAIIYDPSTNSFVGTVPGLHDTSSLLFDSTSGVIYSTDPLNNTVGVFNPGANAWVATIPVGPNPSSLALDPANNTLYVANSGTNNISLINTSTNSVEAASIIVGQSPTSLAFDSGHSQLFVACSGSRFLYVLNTTSNVVANTIPLVGDAGGVAVSEVAGTVAATVPSVGHLTVAYTSNLAVITGTIPIGFNSHLVVGSPSGNEFVVADSSRGHLIIVNASAATVTNASVPVGTSPEALSPDALTGMVYSWSSMFRNLTPVNPDLGTTSLPSATLGARPVATAYDPTANRVFIADALTASVSVLNSSTYSTVAPPISLAAPPFSLADDPSSSTVFVGLNGSIVAIDASTAETTSLNVSVPGVNGALLVDSADGLLWDMNNVSGLIAFHLDSLTHALSTSVGPDTSALGSMALDPATDQLFVVTTGGFGSEVAVIAAATGTTVNAGIQAGPNVTALAFDPADGQVYALGTNLTMIDAATLTVASESIDLPAHTLAGASLVYEPSREFLYATTSVGPGTVGQLTLVDGASVGDSYGASGTLYVGFEPTALLSVNLPGATGVGSGILVVANLDSGSLAIIATSPAEINYLTASPSAIDLGQSSQILVQYIGGAGVPVVSYSGLPAGCLSENTVALTCRPTVSGNFTILVTVTDSLGNSYEATTELSVAPGLEVGATFSPSSFPQLDPGVTFTTAGFATGGTPGYNYTWNFGDGNSSLGVEAAHAYAHPGLYTLTLAVRDSLGLTGTSSWSVSVNPGPALAVTASGSVVDVNHSVSFDTTVTGGTGTGTINWTFGDGATGTGSTALHSWTDPGTYVVNATYRDGLGTPAFYSLSITVNHALSGTFTATPPPGTTPVAGKSLEFSGVPAGGTSPYTVVWNFGDGSMGSGATVSHAYALAGNYTVNVTVTDHTGATLNATLSVSVGASSGTSSSSSSSSLTFPLGLFLGILLGAALAAVVVYAVGPRKRKETPPPPTPATSPGVAPEKEDWKED